MGCCRFLCAKGEVVLTGLPDPLRSRSFNTARASALVTFLALSILRGPIEAFVTLLATVALGAGLYLGLRLVQAWMGRLERPPFLQILPFTFFNKPRNGHIAEVTIGVSVPLTKLRLRGGRELKNRYKI